uniref:Uncharacterized protein n=1 Tax=Amphimedon queenslandica TaxID=400682 RepID=A0A1X7TRS2_AMPQE
YEVFTYAQGFPQSMLIARVPSSVSDLEFLKSKVVEHVTDETREEEREEESEPSPPLHTIRMRGLPYDASEKHVHKFFSPIQLSNIRLLKDDRERCSGLAFVDVMSKTDLKEAMKRNKGRMGRRYIELVVDTGSKEKTVKEKSKRPWEEKEDEETVESIADSGQIFIRNLPYTTTEEELTELFEEYGQLSEINLLVDKSTGSFIGLGYVTFMFPEHAVKAFSELDGQVFQGRLLHLLPSKPPNKEVGVVKSIEPETQSSSFKSKQKEKLKLEAGSSHNWNTLFLGSNAVADSTADQFGVRKSELLDLDTTQSLAVRLALGETQLVNETREFLESHGVKLNLFDTDENEVTRKRSKNVVLVKNLPFGTSTKELTELFGPFGSLSCVILPPAGISALVEYSSSNAKVAFKKLSYCEFKHLPLYLEWASFGVMSGEPSQPLRILDMIVLRNVLFEASKKELFQLLLAFSKIKSIRLPKKQNDNSHHGFCFVEYSTTEDTHSTFGCQLILQPSLKDVVFNDTVEVTSSLIAGIGLPNSGKTFVLEKAFKEFIKLKPSGKLSLDAYLKRKKNEQCLSIYELCALGGPPHDQFAWSFATRHYGAIYSMIHILAHRKNLNRNSICLSPITNHSPIDEHIHWLFGEAYSHLESIKGNDESLKLTLIQDGLALLNVMDFGVNKALHGLLPIILSFCHRNICLVFFSLDNDAPNFNKKPDLLDAKYATRGDKDTAMSQRSKLTQLLHFATLGHEKSQKLRDLSVPFIATTKENASSAQAKETIESQIQKSDLGLFSELINVDLKDKNSILSFGDKMQEFIKYKYKESTIDIPFRSMLFRSYLASLNLDTIIFDKSFIIKEAKCLNITDVDDFLKIFTDFGSILYIPQFESLKKFVIIDVWKFTEYLNKLYYPNLSEPHAEDLSVYGIVSEQSVRDVLFPEKNVSHFMQILTEFGMAATLYSGSSIILEHKALDSDQRYYFLPIARVSSPKSIPLHEDDYVFFEIDNIASPPDVLAGITEELMKNKEVFMLGTTEHNVSLFEFRSKESHLKMEIVCEGDKIKLKVKDIQEDTFSSAVQVCKKFLKASVSFFKRYNNIILNFKYTFAIPCSPVFERYHYYDEGEHYHRKESMLCSHCSNSQDTYKKCWNDAAQKCQYLKHEGYKRSQDVTRLQLENMQFCDTNEELKRQIEDMGKQLEDKDRHIARLTKRSGDQTHDKAYFDFDKASDIDNLKGCQILEKESFLVEGGKCQSINWQKYGLSIDLQEESFLPSTTAKVAVNVFIGGSFVFPKNFVLVSAVYAVSVSKSLFKSFMSLSLQHCIDLKAYPTLTECLEFATVPITTPTPNSIPYKFSIMKGGDFSDSSYGVINQDELCFLVCIVGYSEASLSNGGNGENGGGVNEGSEDEEDIANDDDDCFMEDDGGGQSREQRGNEDSDSSITTGSSSSHADPISDDSSIRSKSPGEKKHHHDDKKHAAASIEKAKRYIIAMFGEECENLVIFAATKRLNALIEHIKKYHNAKKELQHVPFQFEKDKNYIELIFDSKQEPQYTKEWVVSPLMKPCKSGFQLYLEVWDDDVFGLDDLIDRIVVNIPNRTSSQISHTTIGNEDPGNYSCICSAGWTGKSCHFSIEYCESNPCINNGTCVNLPNAYYCNCSSQYEGLNCELAVNACLPDPCQNNSTCINHVTSYSCECNEGFTGHDCESIISSSYTTALLPSPSANPPTTTIDTTTSQTIGPIVGGIVGSLFLTILLITAFVAVSVITSCFKKRKMRNHKEIHTSDAMDNVATITPLPNPSYAVIQRAYDDNDEDLYI